MKRLGACDSHLQVMIELEVSHLGLGENERKFIHKTQNSMQIIITIGEDNNYKKVVLFNKKIYIMYSSITRKSPYWFISKCLSTPFASSSRPSNFNL